MADSRYHSVMMNLKDNVATALTNIPAGSDLVVQYGDKKIPVTTVGDIQFGHKFALKGISHGEDIIKYGEVIGIAIDDIKQGEHVHIHNLDGKRGRGDKIDTGK